ncbi:hypothetical protein K2173_019369 [Erythroxylum novogranatense]|uniref:Uncharacterized protein n=1 Tax=Erythroxylum novogranatense TaxID=1862640 RepID=A0AAV8UEF6_9ROSI|nr:hypothetical protein K2173_019369 [Erythroxylum novogranatense]
MFTCLSRLLVKEGLVINRLLFFGDCVVSVVVVALPLIANVIAVLMGYLIFTILMLKEPFALFCLHDDIREQLKRIASPGVLGIVCLLQKEST